MNDHAAAYHKKLTAPIPNPIGTPSAWWKGVKMVEWHIGRATPLYHYLLAPMTLDEPVKCSFRILLKDGSLKAVMTQKQLERAARVIYGIPHETNNATNA